ncbi:MAG: major capsid protein [Microviridae sp.]|nr:MAG: major capsid protein [Microviridae sp.]
MKNLFNSIQLQKPKSNSFDLSHDVKLSASMGNLTPILTLECVPGDKFNLSCESLIRFAPLIAPVMHRMDVTMHYFFVPNRIVWSNWEKFITDANSGIVPPYLNYSDSGAYASYAKFMDYMGIPPVPSGGTPTSLNLLPFAAYQCIYNEYYRDQNLITPIDYQLADGNNGALSDWQRWITMRKRAWEHDYFTASLPFAQKGSAVDIPIGNVSGDAVVYYNDTPPGNTLLSGAPNSALVEFQDTSAPATSLFANTDGLPTEPTTINDLRRAFRLQEWLEKNARGGTRYIESILSHFGVKSSDKRLQRPEYITGVKSPVIVSEVLNTTGETSGLPQGNMAGHGISVSSGKAGSYYCEEHGYIIGIMSIMPKTAYQQGIPRTFLKNDTLDYYFPSFANIGEQEVKVQELYAYTANAENTFGYVPRYAEYKYMPSRVAGDFRTTLDFWHLGRIFATEPSLNQTFVECAPSNTTRIFAVEDGTDPLYCHVYNKIQAVRPMPKFGTPSF